MHRDAIQKRSSLIDSALGLQLGAWHKHPIWAAFQRLCCSFGEQGGLTSVRPPKKEHFYSN